MMRSWESKNITRACIHNDGIGEIEAGLELLRELSRLLTRIDIAHECAEGFQHLDVSSEMSDQMFAEFMKQLNIATASSEELIKQVDLIRANISKSADDIDFAIDNINVRS